MNAVLLAIVLTTAWWVSAAAAENAPPERIVLLHGLARSPRAMRPLEKRLVSEGYVVHNLAYPSRSEGPEELVRHLQDSLEKCCLESGGTLHFVTHSLGGLLARAVLAEKRPEALGRVVMIAPPSHGTELVDLYGDDWWFRLFLGPTAAALGTGATSFPTSIGPPDYELGIIAGVHPRSRHLGAGIVTGKDDGVVSLESARVEGMTDFLAVPMGHVQIRRDDRVADEVVHFLRTGQFEDGERSQRAMENQP